MLVIGEFEVCKRFNCHSHSLKDMYNTFQSMLHYDIIYALLYALLNVLLGRFHGTYLSFVGEF